MTHLVFNADVAPGGEPSHDHRTASGQVQPRRPILPIVRAREQNGVTTVRRNPASDAQVRSAHSANQAAFYRWIGLAWCGLVLASIAVTWAMLP
jgi:hypothetical protein